MPEITYTHEIETDEDNDLLVVYQDSINEVRLETMNDIYRLSVGDLDALIRVLESVRNRVTPPNVSQKFDRLVIQ